MKTFSYSEDKIQTTHYIHERFTKKKKKTNAFSACTFELDQIIFSDRPTQLGLFSSQL
jgi:hypothetical protein